MGLSAIEREVSEAYWSVIAGMLVNWFWANTVDGGGGGDCSWLGHKGTAVGRLLA